MKPFRRAECFGRMIPVYRLTPEQIGVDNAGAFDAQLKAIGISDDIKGKDLEKVLMHEMFHATLDRLYLDAELDPKFVEAIVENLVTMVFDNWQVKWQK